ncbi:MAG TPA: hypothetical protein VGZ48_12185 [Candidatus Acidoferrales bacterium]|jgi:hypothetical protein|nr:hypothetical protein [Candidatus Acidoferrales bacterium]
MITRIMKGSAIALLALVMLAPMASAQRGGFRGGFGGFRGGIGFGYWGPGWYGYPYYWGPYGYYAGPPSGEVKLVAPAKDDKVFVDGGYAGEAKRLKHFNLPVGTHTIDVRGPGGENTIFQTRIDVIAGKTIHVGG